MISRILGYGRSRLVFSLTILLLTLLLLSYSVSAYGFGEMCVDLLKTILAFLISLMRFMLSVLVYLIMRNPCVHGGVCYEGMSIVKNPVTLNGLLDLTTYQSSAIRSLNASFLRLFYPLYIIGILGIAIYLIFMSGSPAGRTKAKEYLMRLIVGLMFVSLSPAIFQLMLNTIQSVSYSIWGVADSKFYDLITGQAEVTGNMAAGVLLSMIFFIAIMKFFFLYFVGVAILVVSLRYFVISILAGIWPLALFLYFFNPTKKLGLTIIQFTIVVLIIQLMQVTLISLAGGAMIDPNASLGVGILFLGAALLGVAYLPLHGMKLMGWLGNVTHLYSTRGGSPGTRFLGSMMRGLSFGKALNVSASQYMISHSMGPYSSAGRDQPKSTEFSLGVVGGMGFEDKTLRQDMTPGLFGSKGAGDRGPRRGATIGSRRRFGGGSGVSAASAMPRSRIVPSGAARPGVPAVIPAAKPTRKVDAGRHSKLAGESLKDKASVGAGASQRKMIPFQPKPGVPVSEKPVGARQDLFNMSSEMAKLDKVFGERLAGIRKSGDEGVGMGRGLGSMASTIHQSKPFGDPSAVDNYFREVFPDNPVKQEVYSEVSSAGLDKVGGDKDKSFQKLKEQAGEKPQEFFESGKYLSAMASMAGKPASETPAGLGGEAIHKPSIPLGVGSARDLKPAAVPSTEPALTDGTMRRMAMSVAHEAGLKDLDAGVKNIMGLAELHHGGIKDYFDSGMHKGLVHSLRDSPDKDAALSELVNTEKGMRKGVGTPEALGGADAIRGKVIGDLKKAGVRNTERGFRHIRTLGKKHQGDIGAFSDSVDYRRLMGELRSGTNADAMLESRAKGTLAGTKGIRQEKIKRVGDRGSRKKKGND